MKVRSSAKIAGLRDPEGPIPQRLITAFWCQVDTSGGLMACWPWTGLLRRDGYGALEWSLWRPGTRRRAARLNGAHRFSYLLANGSIPPGSFVLHQCDNPPCVHPLHLVAGTAGDNIRQAFARGRGRLPDTRGSLNPASKLTEAQAHTIRQLSTAGISGRQLAARFSVSTVAISQLLLRKTWRHVS